MELDGLYFITQSDLNMDIRAVYKNLKIILRLRIVLFLYWFCTNQLKKLGYVILTIVLEEVLKHFKETNSKKLQTPGFDVFNGYCLNLYFRLSKFSEKI